MCLSKVSAVLSVSLLIIVLLCPFTKKVYAQVSSFDLEYFELKKQKDFRKANFTSQLLSGSHYQNISSQIEKLKKKKTAQYVEYAAGDEKEFFVRNIITGNTWHTLDATLAWQNSGLNIWIEKTAYDTLVGTSSFSEIEEGFSDLLYDRTSSESINSSLGVLEILEQYVGDFPNVDGDEVLDVLLLDIRDSFEETGSFVAGFFDPVNLFEFEYSNEMDLLYLDLYPTIIYDGEINVERAVSTFAHEAQHLIHAGYEGDDPELVFINEGFSEAVEILTGFKPRSAKGYEQFSLRGLFSWNFENPLPDYSRASLWTHYLIERFGSESLSKFIQNPEIGLSGYQNIFESELNISFKEVFRDWGIALTLNDRNIRPEFGYEHPERKGIQLSPVSTISEFPEAFKGEVDPWINISLNFQLARELILQTNTDDFKSWISTTSVYPDSDVQNPQVDNSSSVFVSADKSNHGSIQSLISYFGDGNESYETSSVFSFLAEGEKSGKIINRGYGDGSPDAFYLNASYLALNGPDQKIGVMFPSEDSGYWLKEVLLRTVFRSELEGSGIDGNEERDFELDIFSFTNGQLQEKLIPTTLLNASRETGKLITEAFSLEQFYSQLSKIEDSIIVVISNDADDENFISIGMDEGIQNASFYSETGTGDWVSLAEKSIGGNSLSGWNAIIRINAVISDVPQELTETITAIYNSFDQVFVELEPNHPFDSTSVRMVAQLPDGSFQKGKLVSKNKDLYTFSFPILANGAYRFQAIYKSQDGVTDYKDEQEWEIEIPDGFELGNNYPNPFNPETSLPFILLEDANISWQIYDVLGRKVVEIPEQNFTSGEHSVQIRMDGLASGMYLARAKLTRSRNGLTTYRTKKIMLIK